MKHLIYKLTGLIYIALSLPAWLFWVTGTIAAQSPFYTIALGGVPLGIFFILFGAGKYPINKASNAALRLGVSSLLANIPLLMSFMLLTGGLSGFGVLMTLSMLYITFASLLAFLFLLMAVVKGHSHMRTAAVKA